MIVFRFGSGRMEYIHTFSNISGVIVKFVTVGVSVFFECVGSI